MGVSAITNKYVANEYHEEAVDKCRLCYEKFQELIDSLESENIKLKDEVSDLEDEVESLKKRLVSSIGSSATEAQAN